MESTEQLINSRSLDEQKIVLFFREHLRESYDAMKYKWQYLSDNKSILLFLQKNHQLICTQGMIYYPMSIGGEYYDSAKSESSFLLSDFRGMGYFEKIYAEAITESQKRGIYIFWGFTALGKIWKIKLGFEVFDILFETQYFLSKKVQFLSLLKKKEPLLKKINSLVFFTKKQFKKKPIVLSNFKIEICDLSQKEQLIHSINAQWLLENPNIVSISNNFSFLLNRVYQNSSVKYSFQVVYLDNIPVGYFILNHGNGKISYLVEIVLLKHCLDKDILQSILIWIKGQFKFKRVCYLGNIKNNYNNSIFEIFQSLDSSLNLVPDMQFVLKNSNAKIELLRIENFVINGLWTEGFKI
jgi:hypothetical protein